MEIKLEGPEPPPTEPPVTEPPYVPPTEPPVTEPPYVPPPTEPPIAPPPAATATFWADTYNLIKGECTYLHWDVKNGTVYWNGDVTYNSARAQVCPEQTTTYKLKVIGKDGRSYDQELTIYVEEPAPPPTPPPPPGTEIEYWADRYELESGECTNLHWKVTNAQSVIWNGQSTTPEARVENLCPTQTTTYKLQVTGVNGKTYEREVTLTVKAPEPACDPVLLQTNYLLIVTDSRKLNENLGVPDAWASSIRPQLDAIYAWDAQGCRGVPYYLDLTEIYPSGTMWTGVTSAIRDFIITKMKGYIPGAVAIIGGPDVVPMAQLTTTADSETVYTDDVHVDFDKDALHVPDIPITRLPDGHNGILLNNYLSAFRANTAPPVGTTVFSEFSLSKEQVNLGSISFPQWKHVFTGEAGELTVLLAPPWINFNERIEVGPHSRHLFHSWDTWNSNPPGTAAVKFNVKNLLFNMIGRDNSAWRVTNPATKQQMVVFDVNAVKSIPGEGGWHIFSLVDQSADVYTGNQTPDNSIPLQFLYRGAHHFIGPTTYNYYEVEECWDATPLGLPIPLCHYGLSGGPGLLAQTYYRVHSDDPATSFWVAKRIYASGQAGPTKPYDYKALHSFQYFGLPEPGPTLGTLQPYQYMTDQQLYSDPPIQCPTNNRYDCDDDKLPDKEETWVANTFTPIYYGAIKEIIPLVNIIYEVTLRHNSAGQEIVVFTSVRLYQMDYVPDRSGTNNFMHFGDTEPVEIWLKRQPGVTGSFTAPASPHAVYQDANGAVLYSIDRIISHRHGESFPYFSNNQELTWQGTHPNIFISEGKHAAYASKSECESFPHQTKGGIKGKIEYWLNKGNWHEVCSTKEEAALWGTVINPSNHLPITMNVGEMRYPFFTKMEQNPYLAAAFPNDQVWGDNDMNFCGGWRMFEGMAPLIDGIGYCAIIRMPPNPKAEACYSSWWLANVISEAGNLDQTLCGGAIEWKWCGGDSDRYCGGKELR